MERLILLASLALCLFCLWALGREDLRRMGTETRRVSAEVVDHRIKRDVDGITYTAVYRFEAEGGSHEVLDNVYTTLRSPALGARVELTFPVGHPELARPPRPLLRAGIYGVMLFLMGILLGRLLGLIR